MSSCLRTIYLENPLLRMHFENISCTSNMEKIESQKGKTIILVEGYRYRKDRANADGSTTWRCCKKDGCRGRMKMLNDHVVSSSEHNHAPDPAKNEAAKVVSAIRKRAAEGVKKPRQFIHYTTSQSRNFDGSSASYVICRFTTCY